MSTSRTRTRVACWRSRGELPCLKEGGHTIWYEMQADVRAGPRSERLYFHRGLSFGCHGCEGPDDPQTLKGEEEDFLRCRICAFSEWTQQRREGGTWSPAILTKS